MRFVILLSLLLATPVQAQIAPGMWPKVVSLCKIDYEEYKKGNRTWLETKLRTLREADQVAILSMCYAWGRGLIDGAKLAKSNERTI